MNVTMDKSSAAIWMRGIDKIYGTGSVAFQALYGVDFHAMPGEFVMLNGPSGSGKTTLLSIMGCVLTATQGEAFVFGHQVQSASEAKLAQMRLAYIGFIFQGHNLIQSLTAEGNVALPLSMRGHSAADARAEARRLLERVGLQDKLNRKPMELSGGQRQRVAIARAVAGNPPVILADEPTASLDAETGLSVTELLKEMARERNHTVVVVTHDNRIFHLADRIVNIEDGRIIDKSKH